LKSWICIFNEFIPQSCTEENRILVELRGIDCTTEFHGEPQRCTEEKISVKLYDSWWNSVE
ncbi:MAG: hypothetical protein ACOVOW_08495, partial [Spirosomataceae bacterium]